MKRLINYLRYGFNKHGRTSEHKSTCEHEFEVSESPCEVIYRKGFINVDTISDKGIRVSLLCKKCGYHKSFWKYK